MCLSFPHVILVYACVHSRTFASDLSPHSPTLAPHHYGNVTGTAARFLLNLLRRFWSNQSKFDLVKIDFQLGRKTGVRELLLWKLRPFAHSSPFPPEFFFFTLCALTDL